MALPWRHVQIKPAGLKLAPIAFVLGITQQITQPPLSATEIAEREADVTLALVTSVIDAGNHARTVIVLPGEGDERVRGAVPIPRGNALEQMPSPLSDGGCRRTGSNRW